MSNIRISQLPTAPSAITGSELIPIVQSGQTVQTTVSAIVNSPVQTQTFLTKNNEPTLPNSRYLAVGSGLSLTDGGAQSTYSIGLSGAVANLNGLANGIVVKTSSSLINRSLAISGNGLAVSNADGVAGNPTISVINNLANIAGASGTGILAIAGSGTLNILNISGTTNQISVSNADGSTGNPTIALANNPVVPGTASLTLPAGGTAARPSGVNGMLRYNSDTSSFEGYSAGAWGAIVSGSGVSSFSAGSTGLTPATGTTGGIVLAGTLNAANGGTGVAGTLTGILYGNGTSAHTVTTTAQLLTLLGTVPIANGGTGQTTASTAFNALSPLTTSGDLLYANATNSSTRLAIGSTGQVLSVVGGFPAWTSLSSSVVTTFSGGSTGLTPVSPTTGAVSLAGTLAIGYGGTGLTANPANGQLLIGNGSGYTLATLTAGTGISVTNASGAITIAINGTGEVTSFQTSLSGLTPSSATGGAITLAGTLGVVSGGTSYSSYTIGDMLYANTTTTFSKLGIGGNNYVLSSTGSSPNWIASTGSGSNVLATSPTLTTPTQASYEAWTGISAPSYTEGLLWYDTAAHSLAYYNDSSNAIVHIGQDIQIKVINNTGSSIPNGSPVYITSTSSGQTYPNIALAKADVAATSAVIGLTNGAIANGAIGYVTATGGIDNVNTGTFTVGQVLYLSPFSAGQLQNTVPVTGLIVQVGVVSYVNSSTGKIYVKQTQPLVLATTQGGTGLSSYTAGDMTYYSTGNALSKLGIGTAGQVMVSTGSAPSWGSVAGGAF